MQTFDEKIEQQLNEKNLNAPRITPSDIDSLIVNEQYHIFEGTNVTVCCLKLKNGFIVTGTSACVSTENFDAEIGRQIAKENAKNRIWELEGYRLAQIIYAQHQFKLMTV